jgi:hypothetical protein
MIDSPIDSDCLDPDGPALEAERSEVHQRALQSKGHITNGLTLQVRQCNVPTDGPPQAREAGDC